MGTVSHRIPSRAISFHGVDRDPIASKPDCIFVVDAITRLVLLRDTSKNFPDNTSNALKVCFPEPLNLAEGPWDVGLLLLTMADAGLKLRKLSDPDPANLIESDVLVNDQRLQVASFSTKDLTQVYPITDEVGLMMVVIQLVD